MNTLNREKELIELLVQKLNENTNDNVEVININDYTEERTDHMISVGISNVNNVNPMLPDYDYTVDILIDSYIANDKYGHQFEQNKSELLGYLETYLMDKTKLAELFEQIPVVGFFLTNISNATTEESNQCRISLQVIASYPI